MTQTPPPTAIETVSELKPCPFCGGPAKAPIHYNGTLETGCAGPHDCPGTDVLVPLALWNRRSLDTADGVERNADIEKLAWNCSEWPKWLSDAVESAMAVSDDLDMSTEQVLAYATLASRTPNTEMVVKAIEWSESTKGDWHAETVVGQYAVGKINGTYVAILRSIKDGQDHDDCFAADLHSADEAKSAAQADFDQRIRSALDHIPDAGTMVERGEAEPAGYVSSTTMAHLTGHVAHVACSIYAAPVSIHTVPLYASPPSPAEVTGEKQSATWGEWERAQQESERK